MFNIACDKNKYLSTYLIEVSLTTDENLDYWSLFYEYGGEEFLLRGHISLVDKVVTLQLPTNIIGNVTIIAKGYKSQNTKSILLTYEDRISEFVLSGLTTVTAIRTADGIYQP